MRIETMDWVSRRGGPPVSHDVHREESMDDCVTDEARVGVDKKNEHQCAKITWAIGE